ESRPNVTADAAALCLKSGNAAILRGGSEVLGSNRAIAACVRAGLKSAGLPETSVQLVDTTDRAAVGELITLREYVDIVVPRGGKELIERLSRESRIPMIKHLDGICHVYVEESADPDMAVKIVDNAKTQRYGVCNAMETLLVADGIAPTVLPRIGQIFKSKGVEMRADDDALQYVQGKKVTESDYYTEWLAPVISIRVVKGLDEAIEHIAKYGSQHTDAIVANDRARAQRFLRAVDSSSVMWNASTRFADGYEYGLGAEVGISTDKLHARGPVGLEGLTTQKFVVLGHGEIRTYWLLSGSSAARSTRSTTRISRWRGLPLIISGSTTCFSSRQGRRAIGLLPRPQGGIGRRCCASRSRTSRGSVWTSASFIPGLRAI